MPIVIAKIVVLAFAFFGQAKLFPDRAAAVTSDLDTVALHEENPELTLARRAMAAEGLCESSRSDAENATAEEATSEAERKTAETASEPDPAPVHSLNLVRLVSESCP